VNDKREYKFLQRIFSYRTTNHLITENTRQVGSDDLFVCNWTHCFAIVLYFT